MKDGLEENKNVVQGDILGSFLSDKMDTSKFEDDKSDDKKDDPNDDKSDDKKDDKSDKPDGLDDKSDKSDDKKDDKLDDKADDAPIEEDEDLVEDSIINLLGTEYPSLEGEYEDTQEDVLRAVKTLIQKEREAAKAEGSTDVYKDMPILKDIKEHLEQGGSLVSLIQKQQVEDFSKVELTEETKEEVLERIYREALVFKGNDEEDIEEMIGNAKDAGKLLEKATKGKDILVKGQKQIIDKQIESERATKIAEDEEIEKEIKEIKAVIKSGKLNGFDIDTATASKLEKFAFDLDKDGITERERKYNALSHEQRLFLDMMVMEDFKPLVGKSIKAPQGTPIKLKVKKAKDTISLTNGGKKDAILSTDTLRDFFNGNK